MNEARPLETALETAIGGDVRPLYDFLCRVSGLPGNRVNQTILVAFAESCAARGKSADALLRRMASIHPDEAPGGTALEFLPVCATVALGLRAASDPRARQKLLPLLHELSEDMRFRVRDVVPEALGSIGAKAGTALLDEVAPWMDGYFHAAAVLRALARPEWQATLSDAAPVIERFNQAFALLDAAPRAARRYPGYKALLDAVAAAPRALAPRFGIPVFDALVEAARTQDPDLAALIATSVEDRGLRGRFNDEVTRVKDALAAAAPAPRDPTRIVRGTRRRGRK
jgi:hypothetical protein